MMNTVGKYTLVSGLFFVLLVCSFSLCHAIPADSTEQVNLIGKAVDRAIVDIQKDDSALQIKGIHEIYRLASEDIDGIVAKKADAALMAVLKNNKYDKKQRIRTRQGQRRKIVVGGPRIEALKALCVVGGASDTLELQRIAGSSEWGYSLGRKGSIISDAGYAIKAVNFIKIREYFFSNYQKYLTNSEKIEYLITAIKGCDFFKPDYEQYFTQKINKLFVRIGNEAVPALCGLLEQAGTIYENARIKIQPPTYTGKIYDIVPPALGEIGDERAIPELEKLRSIIKGSKSEPILSRAILEIKGK